MSNICTVAIITWLIAVTSHVELVCMHLPRRSIRYLAYIQNLVGIYVSNTLLVITCKVCTAVGCVLAHMCKNVGCVTYMCNVKVIFIW